MDKEEVYCIINPEKYAHMVRREAADSFAKEERLDENEDLEKYVTINQVCQMIAENAMGKDDEDHYVITKEGYNFLFAQIKTRIYNSGLSKLAAKNLLECAWDEKKKTMIFWLNEKGVVE